MPSKPECSWLRDHPFTAKEALRKQASVLTEGRQQYQPLKMKEPSESKWNREGQSFQQQSHRWIDGSEQQNAILVKPGGSVFALEQPAHVS
jgi:hypothetical protein